MTVPPTESGTLWPRAETRLEIGLRKLRDYKGGAVLSDAEAETVLAERDALRAALERIEDNAEAWHGDNEAKARALKVIAGWCRTALERPE